MQKTLRAAILSSISNVEVAAWNNCAGESPYNRHEFFYSLEKSGSLGPSRGVVPRYICLFDESDSLVACAAGFLKWGNKREFGPEIKWLHEGLQSGCFSWPKFQIGTPFYPVSTQKLMTHPDLPPEPLQKALLQCAERVARVQPGVSVLNVMHIASDTGLNLTKFGAMLSAELQSIWRNSGWKSFDEYLKSLPHRKRYNILKDRQAVRSSGVELRILRGGEIPADLLAAHYEGFRRVCLKYNTKPWLPFDMYRSLVAHLPDAVRMFVAFNRGQFVAAAFCMTDTKTLYVDTWGTMASPPSLCFELICYLPMEYAIGHGLACIDAGPIGRHKTLRGYGEERVMNAHWFFNEALKNKAKAVLAAN